MKHTKIVLILALMFSVLALAGCSKNKEDNSDEKRIADALLININDFYQPWSVKVIAVTSIISMEEDEYRPAYDFVGIKISATTKSGGTNSTNYNLYLTDYTLLSQKYRRGDLVERDYEINSGNVSVKKINEILNDYYEKKGWK